MQKLLNSSISIDIWKYINQKYGKIIYISKQNEAITNKVFYIKTIHTELLLKLLSANNSIINRLDEIKIIQYCMKYNITTNLLDYKVKKYLLFQYIPNSYCLPINNNSLKLICLFANYLSILHNANLKINIRSYKNIINKYANSVSMSSPNINFTLDYAKNILKNIDKFSINLGLSHNDINRFNIMTTKEDSLYIFDFEYSAINDIYFDLASVYINFSKDDFNIFITEYIKITSLNFSIDKLLLYVKLIYIISILWSYKILSYNIINNKLIYENIINTSLIYLKQNM